MDMSGYLYEKDLRPMKYRILISSRHDRVIREISSRFHIPVQVLRRILIERFDMQLLENLPSRYDAGLRDADREDALARSLGCELFSRYVPLVDPERMQGICQEVREMMGSGKTETEIISAGNALIRQVILL
jgi:energy-converting hydrogenase A subunit M